MKLLTHLCLFATVLAAPDVKDTPDKAPLTIGVLCKTYDEERPKTIIPLAVLRDGKWMPHEFFSMAIPGLPRGEERYATTFRPEQDAYLDAMLNQTFYLCANPETTFKVEKKTITHIIDDAYIGWDGNLNGNFNNEDEGYGIAVSNVREICGEMKPSTLSTEEEALITTRMREPIIAAVREWEAEHYKDKPRPGYDPKHYQAPVFKTVIRCSAPSGWRGLWVHALLNYPPDLSPSSYDLSEGESPWSGYYCALVDTRTGAGNQILWEHAACLDNVYGNMHYHLKGVFDANADGKPEFLIQEGAHEYRAFILNEVKDGKWVELSSISGAL